MKLISNPEKGNKTTFQYDVSDLSNPLSDRQKFWMVFCAASARPHTNFATVLDQKTLTVTGEDTVLNDLYSIIEKIRQILLSGLPQTILPVPIGHLYILTDKVPVQNPHTKPQILKSTYDYHVRTKISKALNAMKYSYERCHVKMNEKVTVMGFKVSESQIDHSSNTD